MVSNQKQIITQAKFTYSALGKTFQKQTKTIEEQVKAIRGNNTNAHFYENELLLSKERNIFENAYNERRYKIEELTKKIITMI